MHKYSLDPSGPGKRKQTETAELNQLSKLSAADACAALASRLDGLDIGEAQARLKQFGRNLVTKEQRPTIARELWTRARNPLNGLLLVLATVSYALGDVRAAVIIVAMVMLSIGTSFIQEHRSNEAAARLRSMVKNTASVRRRGVTTDGGFAEVPLEELVPGDIVQLSAGDMIPADLRLLDANDLFINQSALTGEAMPAEKFPAPFTGVSDNPFDLPNMCFMGANVVSGYGTGVIVRTGATTFFGDLADKVASGRPPTAFDKGVARFTWLMIRVISVMVPLVLLINGVTKNDWLEALLFAVAVGVGLTPEMLPMIVTVNLAKGALAMSRAKVIVKRLEAIQNLGAIDILCTDKTGTLTQDRIILKRHLDLHWNESDMVLRYAWLNSHFQSGLKNLLDIAVLEHAEMHSMFGSDSGYSKVDEIPFDFSRRRLSVVISTPEGRHVLVCKGAVEELMAICTGYEAEGERGALDPSHFSRARQETNQLNADGFRVVAVAYKELAELQETYSVADESGLTLVGFIAFLDPPKDSAREALAALAASGVTVKILTGDNDIITREVCREVGFYAGTILLGSQIESMGDEELAVAAEGTSVFAKLTPGQKERIVRLLRKRHVVGFLGDGINDSPPLRAADVGVSVDTAVDIAKEAADIIVLEKSLMVLQGGVIEGRRVFANITKYIRMGASSNFGNMFSVLGASIFLPFLPMLPIQVLTNNLLYDLSQTAIPTDNVDKSEVERPRQWNIRNIFKFMLVMGPVSSLFDYATFAMMLFIFNAWNDPSLFQTGWFVESLLTQTLIIHIIRTAKIPFIESQASTALMATTALICLTGVFLPYLGIGHILGFRPLPWTYWPLLAGMLCMYAFLTHWAKMWFVRRFGM
ncbi:magnesium-translocating P-type ATPase [Pseudoduganella sp. GCM10020061]|uniref:magnesium-translocating P-type ATPase n=1 Tax=Pseudoduganella sp. GCM10020061 TaxID=3317345 RepID=UPI003630DCD9